MQRSFLLFIYIFFINRIKGSSNGDCYLKGIKDIHWLTAYTNDPVDDFEEKEFKRFVFKNIADVEVLGEDYGKYFDTKLEVNYLIIFPTPLFKSFEINERSTLNPEMNVRLNFTCKTGTRQLAFYQPIRDHNTYYPEFGQPSYTYILPIPLPGNFDVSAFGKIIIACDLDISTMRLDFAIHPTNAFSLFSDGPIDDTNKCHKATLKTMKPLGRLSETVYQIEVMDGGKPLRSKIARLEVHINHNNSISSNPQFESAYSTDSYSFKNERQPAVFLKFKQGNYSFEIKSSYQGFVGIVTAYAIPEEVIEYSHENAGKAFIKIDKTTGTLKIITNMAIGTYNLIVYAEGIQSKIRTPTNVTINVVKNIGKLETMNSVLIEHVFENERQFINFPCQCDYCTYKIIEQYPETNPKLFGVYNSTQIYAVPIDREMDQIINMKIPQFMLRLVLTATSGCYRKNSNKMPLQSKSLPHQTKLREWAFIPAIVSNAPDQILASIIIDDVNDNPPVFEAGVKLVIGYPVKSLARFIAPLYLTKVTATDLDAGENAQIRYSTNSSYFVVHPVTGVIYAGDDAVNDDSYNLKFSVIATDRNGVDNGLSTNLIVEVKALQPSQLVVLTIKNMMLEELDGTLENLSKATNMQIKYLNAAVIPVVLTASWSSSCIRLIIYGLDSNDEPVEANILEEAITNSKDSNNFTVDNPHFGTPSNSADRDKTSLITAVVILSILLVCFINIFVAFYYFNISLAKKSSAFTEPRATNSPNSEKSKNRSSLS